MRPLEQVVEEHRACGQRGVDERDGERDQQEQLGVEPDGERADDRHDRERFEHRREHLRGEREWDSQHPHGPVPLPEPHATVARRSR